MGVTFITILRLNHDLPRSSCLDFLACARVWERLYPQNQCRRKVAEKRTDGKSKMGKECILHFEMWRRGLEKERDKGIPEGKRQRREWEGGWGGCRSCDVTFHEIDAGRAALRHHWPTLTRDCLSMAFPCRTRNYYYVYIFVVTSHQKARVSLIPHWCVTMFPLV